MTSAPPFPGRKLGLERARTSPEDASCTRCMALIAASNLRVGEQTRRGTVRRIGKTLTLEHQGHMRRWTLGSPQWPQLIRDLADELMYDLEVLRADGSKSDLLRALERDPAFRWVGGLPELNDDFPRLGQPSEPPVPFFRVLTPAEPHQRTPSPEPQWPAGSLWNP